MDVSWWAECLLPEQKQLIRQNKLRHSLRQRHFGPYPGCTSLGVLGLYLHVLLRVVRILVLPDTTGLEACGLSGEAFQTPNLITETMLTLIVSH